MMVLCSLRTMGYDNRSVPDDLANMCRTRSGMTKMTWMAQIKESLTICPVSCINMAMTRLIPSLARRW